MKTLKLGLYLTCISGSYLNAQDGAVSAGGEAFGSGIVINYSVGQVNYLALSGSNGYVNQGLQQPYELFVATGINEKELGPRITLYPNPVSEQLTIRMEKNPSNSEYFIEDIQGRFIAHEKINESTTSVAMNDLIPGIYFLKLVSDKTALTYKIIKNQ